MDPYQPLYDGSNTKKIADPWPITSMPLTRANHDLTWLLDGMASAYMRQGERMCCRYRLLKVVKRYGAPASLNQNPIIATTRPTLMGSKSYSSGKTRGFLWIGSLILSSFFSFLISFFFSLPSSPLETKLSIGGALPNISNILWHTIQWKRASSSMFTEEADFQNSTLLFFSHELSYHAPYPLLV